MAELNDLGNQNSDIADIVDEVRIETSQIPKEENVNEIAAYVKDVTEQSRLLIDFNAHLLCSLCCGYMIDATTIIECLHSFCRSCIYRYLESCKYCPICDVQVHKTKPLQNVRPDKTLQAIIYKLVPGLFKDEMKRRRDYYAAQTDIDESGGSGVSNVGQSSEDRGLVSDSIIEPRKCRDNEENISVCLELADRFLPSAVYKISQMPTSSEQTMLSSNRIRDKRYLLCPSKLTVGHLKKFIRSKFDLSECHYVDVYHSDHVLKDRHTLQDIANIFTWRKIEPLKLYYIVYQYATINSHDIIEASYTIPMSTASKKQTVRRMLNLPLPGIDLVSKSKMRFHNKRLFDVDSERLIGKPKHSKNTMLVKQSYKFSTSDKPHPKHGDMHSRDRLKFGKKSMNNSNRSKSTASGRTNLNCTSSKLNYLSNKLVDDDKRRVFDDAPVCLPSRAVVQSSKQNHDTKVRDSAITKTSATQSSCLTVLDRSKSLVPDPLTLQSYIIQHGSNDDNLPPIQTSCSSSPSIDSEKDLCGEYYASNEPIPESLEIINLHDAVSEIRFSAPTVCTGIQETPEENTVDILNSKESERLGFEKETVDILDVRLDNDSKIPCEKVRQLESDGYDEFKDKPGFELNFVSPESDIGREFSVPVARKVRADSVRRTEVDQLLTDACKCRDTKRSRKRNDAGVDLSSRRPRLNSDKTLVGR